MQIFDLNFKKKDVSKQIDTVKTKVVLNIGINSLRRKNYKTVVYNYLRRIKMLSKSSMKIIV